MSATPQLPPVAKLEQKTVVDLVTKGKRIDERGLESYRPIQIQVGLIEKANGSAQVFLGNSKVAKMEVKGDEVIEKGGHHQLPLNNYPVAVTFAKIDKTIVVDPSLEEEQVMSARLTVTIDKNGHLCAMQKGGLYGFTPDELKKAVHLAVAKAAENRAKILAAAKG